MNTFYGGRRAAASVGIALSVLAWTAPAQAVEFGAYTFLSLRDCSAIDPANGCNPLPPRLPQNTFTDGGMGEASSASGSVTGLGSVSGSVSFNGPAALPVIRGTSYSTGDSRTGSSSNAVQTYQWTGDAAVDVPLYGTLDFVRSASNVADGNLVSDSALIFIAILLFDPNVISATTMFNLLTAGQTLKCGDAGILGDGFYSDNDTTSNVAISVDMTNGCDGKPFSVDAGGTFGVGMLQQLISVRGGWLDASNTFELTFAPEAPSTLVEQLVEGLRPASVPEPGTLALLGLGLAGLGLSRRRRN